jgi:hypothetical protein
MRHLTGAWVTGQSLAGSNPHDGALCYRGLGYCPILQPEDWSTLSKNLFRSPRKDQSTILKVATNVPSRLNLLPRLRPEGIEGLALLPPGCYAETPLGWGNAMRMLAFPDPLLFAVGGTVNGDGRVLLLADHSIFINEMMLPTDNGNVEFTYNCLAYLRGTDPQRQKVLFVEEGTILKDFNIPLRNLPLSFDDVLKHLWDDPNGTMAKANQFLVQTEMEDIPNRAAFSFLDDKGITPRGLVWNLLILVSIAVTLYALSRVIARSRQWGESAVPLLADAVAEQSPEGALALQRQRTLLVSGNVWESARELARQWFARRDLTPPASGPREPPEIITTGGWRQRRKMRSRIGRLWRLAHNPHPVPVSADGLRSLMREVEELEAALADGSLRLQRAKGGIE